MRHGENEKCKTGALNLTNGSVFHDLRNMQMSFQVKEILGKLNSKDVITHKQISPFKKEAKVFVVTMLNRLFERCLQYLILLCWFPLGRQF